MKISLHENVYLIAGAVVSALLCLLLFGQSYLGTFLWSAVGAGVILAIVGALVWRARHYTQLVNLIEQTPINRIADSAGGCGAVQGSAVPLREVLEAPLSGSRCVAFSVVLRHRYGGRSAKGGGGADTLDHRQSVVFAVDDGSGRIEVVLTKFTSIWLLDDECSRTPPAAHYSRPGKGYRHGILWDASPELKDRARTRYGDRFKHVNPECFPTQRLDVTPPVTEYSETVIEEGYSVYALGPVSVSGGGTQFTERKRSPAILAFGSREDYLVQFRRSARRFWLASSIVLISAVFAVGVIRFG
jgi:hypothetical protein